jgi:hypothetical protein
VACSGTPPTASKAGKGHVAHAGYDSPALREAAGLSRHDDPDNEVIYHALPPALEDFARMCWLYGSGDFYEGNGGHRRLIETAAALALRFVS